jgi:type VI secretion system protein ImpC
MSSPRTASATSSRRPKAGQALLERGLMPLLSYRNRPAARLLRWQSVAQPAQALRGLQEQG